MKIIGAGIFGPVFAVLMLMGCSFFGGEEDSSLSLTQARIARKVDSLLPRLERLRGLTFKRPIHSVVITRAEFCRQTQSSIDQFITDSISRGLTRELTQLGLFPDTSWNYKDVFSNQQCGNPAGYYNIGSDSIFVLAENANKEAELFHILPHELEHALQDQNFPDFMSGKDLLLDTNYTSEFALYRRCVVEGDAFFLDHLHTAHFFYDSVPAFNSDSVAVEVVKIGKRGSLDIWKSGRWPDGSLFYSIDIPYFAPYYIGSAFIGETFLADNYRWDSVNALFLNPNYPSVRIFDPAVRNTVNVELAGAVDTNRSFSEDVSMGSIGLMSVVAQNLDSTGFYSGLGWRGDRYQYSIRSNERWGTFIWVNVFATDSNAAKYAGQLEKSLKRRFLGDSGTLLPVDSNFTLTVVNTQKHWSHTGLRTALITAGPEVWLVEGGPRDWTSVLAILEQGWTARRILPKAGVSAALNPSIRLPLWMGYPLHSRILPAFMSRK